MKKIRKICISFFIANMIIISIPTKVQAYSDIRFNNITIEDGLEEATVETIIQDKYGYIWFGTNDGLTRYNGYSFKVYRNEVNSKDTIASNYIVSMDIDEISNCLWIGTTNGLSRLDLDTEQIKNYTDIDGLCDENITDVLVTRSNHVLVSTNDGLHIYDKSEDRFIRICNNKLDSQEIFSLYEDKDGMIWVGNSIGLNRINIDTEESISYSSINKNFKSDNDTYILNDGVCDVIGDDDNIWIATLNSGVYKLNYITNEYEEYNTSNSRLPSNSIQHIFIDNRGIVWIGTNNGLAKFSESSRNFESYANKIYDNKSLINNDVYTVMQDKSGLIWVGTQGGVSNFDPENKIEHYKVDPSSEYGIKENMIQGIFEDSDGLIWLGTNTKGVNILDRNKQKSYCIDINTEPYSLSSNNINDIKGNKEYIFIGTNNGLNIIDRISGKVKIYGVEEGLNNSKVRTLTYDSKGYLWIGTALGVNILNLENNQIINLNELMQKNGVKDKNVGYIYEDKDGVYWIGFLFNGGLVKLNPNDNTFINYKNSRDMNSLSNDSVRVITEDDEGNLWIGTSSGLNKLNKNNETFKIYTTKDGLPNNNIHGILLDDDKNIWVSTNCGLSKFDRKFERFFNLTINDGIQSNEFNNSSFLKTKDGELAFGGINGLNIFRPENVFKNSYLSTVQFDEFSIEGKKLKNLDNSILHHDQNTINIKLFMADFKNLSNLQYYYKLDEKNSNGEWTLINGNDITLSNLSSGDYKFHVKVKNNNGEFSEVSSVSFKVEPVLWKSPIAIIIYSAIIGIIIGSIIDSKNEKMKVLDNMVNERTMKLHEEMKKNTDLLNKVIKLEKNKNAYLVNISHELRTPLNVLSSMEQLISELNRTKEGISREKIDYYMSISRKNTQRLLKLINDLIDTSKIEHGNYNINIKEHDIVYIVEETALSLKDYVDSKNVELIIDPQMEECIIDCDENEIERCIINLVNNAAKFTNPGGRILISLVELNDSVKIEVADNGIGIEEKHLEVIFDRFNQVVDSKSEAKGGSGLGLTITKLIVELHQGRIFAESEVNVGSKFTIILPKKIVQK